MTADGLALPAADRTSLEARHLAFLMLMNVVWGLATVATKMALGHMPPILATCLRFSLVAIVLLPYVRWVPGKMTHILAIAICAGGVQLSLFYTGLSLSSGVASTAILGQLGVPFATILSILVLGEVVRWRRWTGIAIAFGGTMVLGFDPVVFDRPLGAGLVLLATLVGAFSSTLLRRLKDVGVFQLQGWVALISAPIVAVATLVLEQGQAEAIQSADWVTITCIVYTALASSLIGHGGLYYLLQRYPVSLVTPFTLMAPIMTVVFGVLLLGESLTLRMIVGGSITFIGVLIITLRKPEETAPHAP